MEHDPKSVEYLEGFLHDGQALNVDSGQTELEILTLASIEPTLSVLLEPPTSLARQLCLNALRYIDETHYQRHAKSLTECGFCGRKHLQGHDMHFHVLFAGTCGLTTS